LRKIQILLKDNVGQVPFKNVYNCLVELDAATVYRGVLRHNIEDALSTRSRAHNFVGALFAVLRILLPREGGLSRTLRGCLPLNVDAIEKALTTKIHTHTHTRYTQHVQHSSQVLFLAAVVPHLAALSSGHCLPLAVFRLSLLWLSMWPSLVVSVGIATSLVVLMW